MISTAPVLDGPRQLGEALLRCGWNDTIEPIAARTPAVVPRVWDLQPGDHFHGRTIAAVHGTVGLASSPVAVITFHGHGPEHPSQARIGATHTEADRGHDELRPLARAWVCEHGLSEGQALDLGQLRTDVLAAIARD